MDLRDKQRELAELRERARQLEADIADASSGHATSWPPRQFYSAYYAMTGFLLGGFAAAASLLVNVIGAPLAGKSPLELIKVYLTVPLGEEAFELSAASNGDLIMTLGCCLYLGTGMLLGVPMYFLMVKFCGTHPTLIRRLSVGSLLALGLWLVNFYLLLSWLQPILFGGNWITDPHVLPPWVAAGTHLVFGWALALLYPYGRFTAFDPAEDAA